MSGYARSGDEGTRVVDVAQRIDSDQPIPFRYGLEEEYSLAEWNAEHPSFGQPMRSSTHGEERCPSCASTDHHTPAALRALARLVRALRVANGEVQSRAPGLGAYGAAHARGYAAAITLAETIAAELGARGD